MKRRINLVLALMLIAVMLTGCSYSGTGELPSRFITVDESAYVKVAYDSYTNVMYTFTYLHGNPAGFSSCTMLVDEEGRPLLYVPSEYRP